MRKRILKSESRWISGEEEILKGISPWEVARRLAHLPELVFLDSALERKGAVSIVAACPDSIIEGETLTDWERLVDAVRSHVLRQRRQPAAQVGRKCRKIDHRFHPMAGTKKCLLPLCSTHGNTAMQA